MALSSAMYNGVSGLNSFSSALEVTSDNVANAGTSGFKSNAIRFGDLVSSYYNTQSKDTDRRGSGSSVLGIATDFAQGPLTTTSSWSDMAINGNGYFSVEKDLGAGTQYYTRDGGFHVDMEGYLVNYQGYFVTDADGEAIRIEADMKNPQYTNFHVENDGQIWAYYVDSTLGTDPVEIPGAQVGLFIFPNEGGLIRRGGNLFTPGPESKDAISVNDLPNLRGDVVGYTLENSNVDLAKEMVNMIVYQSIYNANTKSITTSRDMLDNTVNLVR